MDIGEFYSKLVNLWNELNNLVKVPVCTCSGCKCEAASKIVAMYEEDKVHQFLMGLNNEAYSTIRSQILAMDPLPSLDRIFNITQQEEKHKQVVINRDQRGDSVMAFAVKEQPKMVEKGTCKVCGRFGHEESSCYEVIGYPPGWGTRGRGRGQRGGRNNRGGRGVCRGRGRETAAALQKSGLHNPSGSPAVLGQSGVAGNTFGKQTAAQVNITGLTQDQVQRLLSLIDAPNSDSEKLSGPHFEDSDWIG